jgi:N-methylhydantoinase A/oxoprolinase/acetone carboxylase beta subunit
MAQGLVLVGIDIGGTFTDFVLLDSARGQIRTAKLLTDPAAPDGVVMKGITRLLEAGGIGPADVDYVVHGTTLVTNAVIERKGAPTWLITTRGFRDALEIRREKRYDLYDLALRVPPPLVPRHRRLEVDERMDADGDVVLAPEREDVAALLKELPGRESASYAISLLHAYRNGENEARIAGWIRELAGEKASVSLSSEVAPEIREYERTSTTAINAYVQPVVAGYLDRLEGALKAMGIAAAPMIMLSHGGLARFPLARKHPVRILESGPAGGAAVAAYLAKALGIEHAFSFDMGGTTAKVCLIDDATPRIVPEAEVGRMERFKKGSGLPVLVPMVDLIEIGAGGGSIAAVDGMGLLGVGPESAGASPGPACYGSGGSQPTVSDANLLLGYLDPDNFLGGEMRLDTAAAQRAFGTISASFRKSAVEVAWAIHATVNQNMVRAAQMHAFDCARDLADYTMICFGGAAPAHACRVAAELGMKTVIIPVGAGVASALGFLVAPASMDLRRTLLATLDRLDFDRMRRLYGEMLGEALEALKDVDVSAANARVSYAFEARFNGQAHALVAEIGASLEGLDRARLEALFKARYAATYGEHPSRSVIEVTALQLHVQGPTPLEDIAEKRGDAPGGRIPVKRPAYFPELGSMADTPALARAALATGERIEGPAILQDPETTVVLPPGASASIDGYGNIVIDVSKVRGS